MFPSCQYTGPYFQIFPYQKEPNSYPCQYCSGWGSVRPSAFVPSPSHEFSHLNLSDHSGCCRHGLPPGCYNPSPQFCPNVQPPSHPYYYGPYLPYPCSYPAYFVAHPRNAFNQAQHDFDKTHSHCCRCPNSSCYRKGDTSPKIEEAVHEKELDMGSSGSDRLPNYSLPVVWVPTSSIKDREVGEDTQLQPGCLNGSVPLDIDSSKVSSQEDEGKNENKWPQKQSLFPIIWMPGYDKPREAVTDLKEITPGSVEEPEKLKIIPLKLLGNDDHEKNSRALEESRNEVQKEIQGEKESRTKTIPVKPAEERSQKKTSMSGVQEKKVDKEKATTFEKKTKESEMLKKSEEERPSPVKSTKLRPVCLRVDPLPKKRMTNGASRSPSPPGHKDMKHHPDDEGLSPREETGEETSERKHIVSVEDNGSSKSVEEKKCQENIHVPVGDPSKEPLVQERARTEGRESGGDKDSQRSNSAENESELKIDGGNEHERSSENKEVKENKGTKRDLSQTDAAVIIQSAYRGFEVRRWQPLEKLRKIRKIREEANSVRMQVQSIGVSTKELGAKQKTIFGETIMNLLLQLDTIQGLHPSVREVRKTVARELVLLQEKLDSLGCVEENKPASDEEETMGMAGEAASANSDSLAGLESLEEDDNSIGSGMKPAELDVNSVDSSCDGVVSPSSINETVEENCTVKQQTLEYVQPAEENCTEKQPTLDYVRPAEENCIENQPALEYVQPALESVQPAEENCTEKQPSLECVQPAEDNCTEKQPTLEYVQPVLECVQPAEENCTEKKPTLEYVQPMLECVRPAEENCGEKQPTLEYVQPVLECIRPTEENYTKEQPTLEYVRPAEECCVEKQPVLENVDCDRSNRTKHDVTSPTFASEPAQDTSTYLSVEIDPACWQETSSESPFSGSKESDPEQEKLEKLARGKDDPIELAESDNAPFLVTKSDCKKDEPINTAEDNNLRSFGGATLDYDAMKCLQQHQDVEVKYQEHEAAPVGLGAGDDSGHSDITAGVENVDGICNGGIPCPEHAMEIGNVEATGRGNLEVWATKTSEVTGSNDENGIRVFADKIETPPTSQLIPADECVGDGTADFIESLSVSQMSKDAEDQGETDKSGLCANKDVNKEDRKLVYENEKLKDIVEKLLAAGKHQSDVISNLTGRVEDLERKLVQKKKKKRRAKVKPNRRVKSLS